MFDKILIANRGEIAVRIIRACREMGIRTVAVFSEADRDALHTQMADEAVCIGGAKVAESYLNMQNIISVAVEKKIQAIHPGFGFLSENSTFASMCEVCNIKFIGPSPSVIDAMGNKANAREMMIKAGVPVIPGSDGVIESLDKAYEVADRLGYPVMVERAFVLCAAVMSWRMHMNLPNQKQWRASAMMLSIWRSLSRMPDILRCRC